MRAMDRLFLAVFMLARNPGGLALALVIVPILIVFAVYVGFEIGLYVAVAGTAVLILLKFLDARRKRRGQRLLTQRRFVAAKDSSSPRMIAMPQPPPPLLEEPKGPQKW